MENVAQREHCAEAGSAKKQMLISINFKKKHYEKSDTVHLALSRRVD